MIIANLFSCEAAYKCIRLCNAGEVCSVLKVIDGMIFKQREAISEGDLKCQLRK